jgi:hypothetical protein
MKASKSLFMCGRDVIVNYITNAFAFMGNFIAEKLTQKAATVFLSGYDAEIKLKKWITGIK